ncbi:RluA family pseudouridine synthase [Candidatus Saccharibacteria bacterium]|jgi:23S rRNA pseudouridine1911/1915/1917 synthase|nr:RluA family pseudouridine synthase [Candidatus Saccharibacteria bacterium]
MKFDSSDILALLRLFKLADDKTMPRTVEKIEKFKPYDKNVVIKFQFRKQKYAILIDSAAEDDESYILSQVVEPGLNQSYQIKQNPNSDGFLTYAMPFRGKECYLLADEPNETRLDLALVERFGKESRSTYQKLIKKGLVLVNDEIKHSPRFTVKDSDRIDINSYDAPKETVKYETLYEDENVLVINKPSGMLTHAKGPLVEEFTAADIISPSTSYKVDTNRPGIVHRLDRDTSGVLLMVKNSETAELIQRQFSDRKVKKEYLAIVSGKPDHAKALIDAPIERNPLTPSTFRVGPNGKEAQTAYSLQETNDKNSLILLKPRTGRTHQLRVHLQYINTPIVGDRVYGKEPSDRMYLHASKLELTLPGGVRKVFEAPCPPEFKEIIE